MTRYLILSALVILTGCAGIEHGANYQAYARRILATNSMDGEKILQIESNYDPSVHSYVHDFGKPNYLYIETMYELYFVYLSPVKCIRFKRPKLSNVGKVEILAEIPNDLLQRIPEFHPKTASSPEVTPPRAKDSWRSFGTGFAVGPKQIVTAHHIIRGNETIEVRFGLGDWYSVKLWKASLSTDVAILSSDIVFSEHLKLHRTTDTLQGDRVFTMGFPVVDILGREPKYTEGVISSLSGIGNDDCLLQITVPVQPGSSGGPLVREDGMVVGMVTSSVAVSNFLNITGTLPQNVNWAVKSQYIQAISEGTDIHDADKMDRQSILENVRNSVCQIRAK